MKLNAVYAILLIVVSIVLSQTIVSEENITPRVDHVSLLNGLNFDYQTGNLSIDDLIITSLPEPSKESKSKFVYNPDDGGELYATLTNGRGKVIGRFDFFAEKKSTDSWEVEDYKLTQKVLGKRVTDRNYVNIKKGDYKLIFYAEGREFYTFPFQVDLKQDKDPISPEDIHTLEGDWNNLGYLGNTNQNLTWNTWLRDKNGDKEVINTYIELLHDEKPIASSDKNATYTITPKWTLFSFNLNLPEKNNPLTLKDLTQKDGFYNLRITIDGNRYAQWRIEVKNGQLIQKDISLKDVSSNLLWHSKVTD